jgi:uncharacterized protein
MYYQIAETNIRIMGSIHMFPVGRSDVPTWALGAFDWADEIVFEADSAKAIPFFKSKSNEDLRDALTPLAWAYLLSIWPADGPLCNLNAIRPWAALLVAPSLVVKLEQGIEPRFHQWAHQQSKRTSFLETPEQFAQLLESVPLDDVLAAIDLFIANAPLQSQVFNEIYCAWLSGSPAKTYEAASKAPSFGIQSLREAILDKRNQLWVPSLKASLSTQKKTLVVVGALHLHGDGGLLSLLGLPTKQLSTNG